MSLFFRRFPFYTGATAMAPHNNIAFFRPRVVIIIIVPQVQLCCQSIPFWPRATSQPPPAAFKTARTRWCGMTSFFPFSLRAKTVFIYIYSGAFVLSFKRKSRPLRSIGRIDFYSLQFFSMYSSLIRVYICINQYSAIFCTV